MNETFKDKESTAPAGGAQERANNPGQPQRTAPPPPVSLSASDRPNVAQPMANLTAASSATTTAAGQIDYIDYEQFEEKAVLLADIRARIKTADSETELMGSYTGLGSGTIFRIHRTGKMTHAESELIADYLEKTQSAARLTNNGETQPLPSVEQLDMREKSSFAGLTRTGGQQTSGAKDARPMGVQNSGLPNRNNLYRQFNARFFAQVKNLDEYVFIYHDRNTKLRLICKTGLRNLGMARNSSAFEVFKEIEIYIFDMMTQSRIKKLSRAFEWTPDRNETMTEINDTIADLLLEVHYRPYCMRHRQHMKLITAYLDENKQFWGCDLCKEERRMPDGRENIRAILSIEKYKQRCTILDRQITNANKRNQNLIERQQQMANKKETPAGNIAPAEAQGQETVRAEPSSGTAQSAPPPQFSPPQHQPVFQPAPQQQQQPPPADQPTPMTPAAENRPTSPTPQQPPPPQVYTPNEEDEDLLNIG